MKIHIAFVIDDNYVTYFLVALLSLYKSKLKESEYSIHVIYNDISNLKLNLIKAYAHILPFKLKLYKAKSLITNASYGRSSFTAGYLRLQLPYILHDIDKVVYLDSDVIINADLTTLFNVNPKFIAATECASIWYSNKLKELYGLRAPNKTIQSGVMVMNLKNLRVKFTHDDYVEASKKKQIAADQDILSVMFGDSFTQIENSWNQTSIVNLLNKDDVIFRDFIMKGLLDKPKIIHYDGLGKPWNTRFLTQRDKLWIENYNDLVAKLNIKKKRNVLSLYVDLKGLLYRLLKFLPPYIKKQCVDLKILNI